MRQERTITHRAIAFTLIEMLIAITVLAIIIAIAVPRMTSDDRLRLQAAASLIISDIEYAQLMSISSPNDPAMIRFDPENNRYWIARTSAPNDPIIRADTNEAYLVVLGVGRAVSAAGVALTTSGMTNKDVVQFNSHGGLFDFSSAPVIALSMPGGTGGHGIEISIAPTTGSLRETATVAPPDN